MASLTTQCIIILVLVTIVKTETQIVEIIYGTAIHPLLTKELNDATYVPFGMDVNVLKELGFNIDNSSQTFRFKHKFVGNKNYDIDPWKKLMISLNKREVEMIMPFGYLTPEIISKGYDTSVAVYPVIYGAVMRKISIADSFKQYIQPFEMQVWVTIGGSTIFFGLILALTYYCSPYSGFNEKVANGEAPMLSFSLPNAIYATFCALFQQDRDGPPKYTSGKIIFTTYFVCTYLILQGYSAVLISFLATGSDKLPFDDVRSLTLNEEYAIGTDGTFDTIEMFKSSPDTDLRSLAQKILSNPKSNLISNPEVGIEKVLTEKFVYITALNAIEPYLRLNCKLLVAIPRVTQLTKHLILMRNHTFTNTISKQIYRLRSAGVINRIYSKYYPKIPNSCDQGKETVDPISMRVTYPIFYVLAFSYFISGCTIGLEIYSTSKKKKKTVNYPEAPYAEFKNEKTVMYRTFWIYKP
ncbi:hypothetical protein CHUAL_004652 [Chamberlinius hualienensis]